MPNLVGLSPSEMKAISHEYLLYYVKRGPGAAETNWGRVLSQSPAAGTAVKKLSTAYITVSK
jgi:beta-lactam-binding protein with PASTA domain